MQPPPQKKKTINSPWKKEEDSTKEMRFELSLKIE